MVLCHKPAQLQEVASQAAGRAQVVVSILAATTTASVEAAYPGAGVPLHFEHPGGVGRGVLCYTPRLARRGGPEGEILELLAASEQSSPSTTSP